MWPDNAGRTSVVVCTKAQLKIVCRPANGGGFIWWQCWTNEGARQLNICRANNVPLVAAFRFHDIGDNHHPCFAAMPGLACLAILKLLREADTIIAINIRSVK